MPGSISGATGSAFGVSGAGLAKPLAIRQSAVYWSNSSSIGTTTITFSKAPINTIIAMISADTGNNQQSPYFWAHTNYKWRKVHSFQADYGSYEHIEAWIGQPIQQGVAGGTAVTFTHNGNAAWTAGWGVEYSRPLKGEVVDSWYAWGNAGTTVNGSPYSFTFTTPNERGLVLFAGAAWKSGGAGPSASSTVFAAPGRRSDDEGGAGLLAAGTLFPTAKQTFSNVGSFWSGPSQTGQSAILLVVR